jgi:hypothetical protein
MGSRIPQRASSSLIVAILAVGLEFIKEKEGFIRCRMHYTFGQEWESSKIAMDLPRPDFCGFP